MDLIAILIVTPLSDRFHHHRALFFSGAVLIQIAGLLVTTFAGGLNSWARYGGLLMVGFGLGPTVPICMAMTNEIFQSRHGEVGVAAASALVSGLGKSWQHPDHIRAIYGMACRLCRGAQVPQEQPGYDRHPVCKHTVSGTDGCVAEGVRQRQG
jgi:hypothetical protein